MDELLKGEMVTFVPDTNFFCEFEMLNEIPWKELCPNAKEIRIFVTATVAEEMDGHKKKTGRLRRRGLWFNGLQRQFENNDQRPISIEKTADPRVTFEIGRIYKRSELDGDQFELDDRDQKIVAEACLYFSTNKKAIFLADDGKSIRLATSVGLQRIRPKEDWRRQEPADEKDTRIRELEEQLGALPELSVNGDPVFLRSGAFAFEKPKSIETPPLLAERIFDHLIAANPRESDASLAGKVKRQSLTPKLAGYEAGIDVEGYKHRYRKYEESVRKFSQEFIEHVDQTSFVVPLRFFLENTGRAMATDVVFSAELQGELEFFPDVTAEICFGRLPEPPEPPKVRDPFYSGLEYSHLLGPREPPDPYSFHLKDFPELKGGTKRMEWRCAKFRHGDEHVPYCFAKGVGNKAVSGAVKLSITAGNLTSVISKTVPIRVFEVDPDDIVFFETSCSLHSGYCL